MWSYFQVYVSRHAVEFCTCCSFSMQWSNLIVTKAYGSVFHNDVVIGIVLYLQYSLSDLINPEFS